MKHTVAAAALVIFLIGCGDSSDDQRARLVSLCDQELNVPSQVCECIGVTAETELNSDERAMVIAIITTDQETADKLRASLPMESMVKSGMFMASAPGRCAMQKQSEM